jgi:uncharacterized lipoprotein YajG
VERNPPSEIQEEQEIVTMHKLFALVAVVLLSGCSTIDATVDGTGGVIKGVGSDVFGVTAGVLDVTSNLIKDVAAKTGTDATAPTEKE